MAQIELVTWLVGIERIDGALRQVREDIATLSRDLRELRAGYELLTGTNPHRTSPDTGASRDADLGALSPAERRVAALVVSGESNLKIAARLHVSIHTVKSHVASILRKLNLEHRWQLALMSPPPTPGMSQTRVWHVPRHPRGATPRPTRGEGGAWLNGDGGTGG